MPLSWLETPPTAEIHFSIQVSQPTAMAKPSSFILIQQRRYPV